MASAKYRNLFQYLKKKAYPEGFTKQKTTLRKFARKFEYDSKLESLFYAAKEKLRRLVYITEEEKARVFEECHSTPFSGHAGRGNAFAPCKVCSQGVVLGRNRFNGSPYYISKRQQISSVPSVQEASV